MDNMHSPVKAKYAFLSKPDSECNSFFPDKIFIFYSMR